MNIVNPELCLTQSRHNHGGSLPEVGAEPEEGVVVLTLVSLAPGDSKARNDNYLNNPTIVVKQTSQLGINQTLKLVEKDFFQVQPDCTVSQAYSLVRTGSHSKFKLCSTRKSWYRGSKDSKRNVSRKYGSVVKSSADRQTKTPQNTQSALPSKASKKCVSGCILSCCNSCSFSVYRLAPQKKGLSPVQSLNKIKYVNNVSCVSPCLFAPNVQNVHNVVTILPVGGRLQEFWQVWQRLGANPRVVSILKEGYTLPFKMRPHLTRSPIIQSGYANPTKSRFLKEALINLKGKLVVEPVIVRSSLAYNRLFLVPKPDNKWRPILDLSQLNRYLSTGTFKMETPETVWISLQKGEWVTSLDFSDAYFHIRIHPRS